MHARLQLIVPVTFFALVACGSDPASPGATDAASTGCTAATAVSASTITVQDFAFAPTCVKVAAGGALSFVNSGAVTHTVTSDAGAPNTFDNLSFRPGTSLTQTFAAAGVNGVHCDYHAQMVMTVIVE